MAYSHAKREYPTILPFGQSLSVVLAFSALRRLSSIHFTFIFLPSLAPHGILLTIT
ncbi:hypothetical protein [Gilliamella sp. Pas-s25]|uniref:hypothetical protein n=1 Tax=Gilliamella sp. Pas-s25 TaxID=2687310 RepID=UPI00135ED857|nr:hypothetical protein [Gilliamella sp. Pas-s25]MWP63281.1 hypothetical protein [Gilliamella sp. Pas-s25]